MRVFTGRNVGSFIEGRLKSAREYVVVVSPWIGPSYANLLAKLSKRVKVFIITSNSKEKWHRRSIEILSKAQRIEYSETAVLAGGIIGFLAGLILGPLSILTALFGAYIGYKLTEKERKDNKLHLKIVDKKFIHSKIYIVDGEYAVIGSPNMTKRGFHKNIETITIYEGEEARQVIESFKKLWQRI